MSDNPPSRQEKKETQSGEKSADNNTTNTTGESKRDEKLKKLYERTNFRMANEIPDD